MTNSAKTIHYFSFYLFLTGLNLLIAPNLLLQTFGMPPTEEVWIRVVGMLVFLLGAYYYGAARAEMKSWFKLSVFTRLSVPIFFVIFVAMGWAKPSLLLFGGIDAAGAIWTYLALKKEGIF
jgi:hypothetical protein